MIEIWKEVEEFYGNYKVSNLGRIQSLTRTVICKNNAIKPIIGKIISFSKSSSGYLCCPFRFNNKSHNRFIHRIVLKAFVPLVSYKNIEVNHIDGDKTNNNVNNLEWVTHSENQKHAYKYLGRVSPNKGKFGKLSKSAKSILQYDLFGNFIRRWDSGADYERETGRNSGDIFAVISGRQKTAHGYKWKLANENT